MEDVFIVYVLFGGTSADGCGPGEYITWSYNKEKAAKFLKDNVENNPYSVGSVMAYTAAGVCKRVYNSKDLI